VALGALAWISAGSVIPAQAASTPPPPWLLCQYQANADLGVLERSLSPANGATVSAGSPVTFVGSTPTLTFAVASSTALLSSPDIDSGPGSARPEPSPSGTLYAFTSTRATATPGTVYWDASFSTTGLTECNGQPAQNYTTQPRTLTVLPAPISTPAPAVAPPAPVQVRISAPASFHLAHPIVLYRIRCTASCSGETYYKAFVVRRHARTGRAPKLGLGPEPVSIVLAAGGGQQVTHRYTGGALRTLASILRAGGVVELKISVKVTDASGDVVRAQRTARLQA
jgi:hypothetical protein